ncbi:MAG TPA: serine/threonine-protein kinase [Ktedonobacteraceae bacterium]|nr:serine/threonine-protein kinase [Ktedonobacteraceae bacterium]
MSSTSPRRIGKYELFERLGRGGMAEVWKALDTQLGRYVAIKILHPDLQSDPNFLTRFEREARVIASLHHPNIVQIYDFHISHPPESEETLAYMVMDYVEGQTMAQYLRNTSRAGKFPSPADLIHLFTPICLAVDYAHQKGMIHRDLKPANILLDQRGTLRNTLGEPILSDFGIAKLLGTTTSSLSGWWVGTPSYISPEQVSGSPGNELSDIYSLGVILYETCTGTLPFVGDNPTAIMMQHINATPTSPALINPNIPPALTAVIMRGLAKTPESRFPSAASMAIAIAEALGMPISENLRQTASQMNEMNNATQIGPMRSYTPLTPSPEATPSPWATQFMARSADVPPTPSGAGPISYPGTTSGSTFTPHLSSSSSSFPSPVHIPMEPASTRAQLVPDTGIIRDQQHLAPSPSPLLSSGKQRRGRIFAAILIAILLVGASLGTLLLLTYKPPVPASPQSKVVGHAFFVNSGQLNPDNSQGINDELLIDLHNIPDPPVGKAYYGWLLGDRSLSEQMTIALGQLAINHGNLHMLYQGNTQHSNLLLYESRFLITEEDATVTPSTYTPDYNAWRYYGEISQAPSPKDKLHFTMLDHLRHLTSESPELKLRGLRGGLNIWFLRNTQKILEWTNAARDDWSTKSADSMHQHFIRILDYLDGAAYVQKDAPAVGPTLLVSSRDAQVALLGPAPDGQDPPGYSFDDEVPPGYVYLVSSHLGGTVLSPDATQDQRILAASIQAAINRVKNNLEQVHQDAKQLLMMTPDQLLQPSTLSILDDMVTQTQEAYSGQTDPLTGQSQGGTIWIYNNIQRLANFEVKPYIS